MFQTKKLSSLKDWRTQLETRQLISQISSILLQRRNWAPILRTLRLSSKLTPASFFQILVRIRSHPQVSLSFYNWVSTNFSFEPNFKSRCYLIRLALGSGLTQAANSILNSLIHDNHSVSSISDGIYRASMGDKLSSAIALDYLIEYCTHQGLAFQGLEVFSMMRANGITPSLDACNVLMEAVYRKKDVSLTLCYFGSMIRVGLWPDNATWSLMSKILYEQRKLQTLEKLLDSGICNLDVYAHVIEGFSMVGNLEAAFDRLTEMQVRNLGPGLDIYTSLLEGACKYEKSEMIDSMICLIAEKGFILSKNHIVSDMLIRKLCDFNRVNAAIMFYGRASDQKIGLHKKTYQHLLETLSKNGMVHEALGLYKTIEEKGLSVQGDGLIALADLLCSSTCGNEESKILEDIIKNGFSPSKTSIVILISSLCSSQRWRELEQWLNVLLDNDLFPESVCLKPLFKHYYGKGETGKAMDLHKKLKHMKGSLDFDTYNVILEGLIKEKKIEDALSLFKDMIEAEKIDSRSFTKIIRALYRAKEQRKAMELHDQMLKIGMKPDKATYRKLILELTSPCV